MKLNLAFILILVIIVSEIFQVMWLTIIIFKLL